MTPSIDGLGGRLGGRVAIVTGGAGGIGRATCGALSREGAAVVVADLDGGRVQATIGALEAEAGDGRVLGVVADVRNPTEMEAMAARTVERFGRIDILVAAAGILRGRDRRPKPLAQITAAEFDEVVGTNLNGTFLSNRAVLRYMVRQRSGQIVNISSTSGRRGRAFDSVYCASKFGVIGLSESEAEEARPYGIRVHVVLPGAVRTDLWEQNGPIPCPRDALEPSRVADLVVWLLLLPEDTQIVAPVIVPFRRRSRPGALTPAET